MANRALNGKLIAGILLLFAMEGSQVHAADDAPNQNLEKRIYRIYSNPKQISNTAWNTMVKKKTKDEVYIAQAGDTLASISKTLFGDSSYWPKLWAENPSIENPNHLTAGIGVRLLAGNSAAGPRAQVVTASVARMIRLNPLLEFRGRFPLFREQALKSFAPEEVFDQNAIEVDELVDAPEIPPRSTNSVPVLTELPPSFKAHVLKRVDKYDATGVDAGNRPSYSLAALVIPNSYLADSQPEDIGKVIEIESQLLTASLGQNVFVHLSREAKTGEQLSILYVRGNIKEKEREVGPIVEIDGIVQVLDAVEGSENTYRAEVIRAVNPIRLDAIVSEMKLPRETFASTGTRLNIEASIVGGEFDDRRTTFGSSAVVFLDSGTDAGINVGDLLPVRSNRLLRRDDTVVPEQAPPIGLLKIVKAEATVSTAFVLQASEEIKPGDRTGGPMPKDLPQLTDEPLTSLPVEPAKGKVEEQDIE